jgi:glycosyltransferase involved in cell wall biosynthesis
MKSVVQIAGVSDVSLGFGSPEILAMLNSLAEYYDGQATVFEVDEITRPPLKKSPFLRVKIERVPSKFETYSWPFRIDYITKVATKINQLRPDVLVIFCTFSLPVLFKLRFRPRMVIYHCYEMVTKYGQLDIEMNRAATPFIDLITFPEENRARIDTEICGFQDIPKVIVYNCADLVPPRENSIQPANLRNGRIIYFGTIDRRNALSDYFLDSRLQGIPVDLYGRIVGSTEDINEMLTGFRGTVRYHGLLGPEDLVNVRREYAFSIVMWNPRVSDNHFYAAPNRLFTSIQAGVPPIVAPHPQCKMVVSRYKCGIIMRDWSFDAFHDALKRAMEIYGTPQYAEMVENCRKATILELNWEKQFDKIKPYLKAVR